MADREAPGPTQDPPQRRGAIRAYLGLALLGWGLSILLGIIPHEDRWVGAGLGVFGFALTASSPRLVEFPGRLSPWVVATTGLCVMASVLAMDAASGAHLNGPKIGLLALGAVLVMASPVLGWRFRIGRRGRTATVASLVVGVLAMLGAPLAVWSLQAVTKGIVGTTPLEAFIETALLPPIVAFLRLIGLHPVVDGQTVTYGTTTGPLALEVGAACSGIQAMALFSGVLALFLWSEKPGGRRLALWTLIGLGGVYVANLLRLATLFVVGYQWGPDALTQVHAQAGWTFFVAWALVFARLARGVRRPA